MNIVFTSSWKEACIAFPVQFEIVYHPGNLKKYRDSITSNGPFFCFWVQQLLQINWQMTILVLNVSRKNNTHFLYVFSNSPSSYPFPEQIYRKLS